MTSTYSTNKAIEEPANGDYVNTWSTPVNSNFNIIDTAFGGHVIINATGASGTVALTTAQYQNLYILFSGTLSANVNYQVPSGVGGQWVVYNGTSGAFTLTLSSGGGGSSVTITQGTRTLIVSDGTNVTLSVNTVTSPGGADTSIQFNQSGVFGGSSNLAWNYGTNTLTVNGNIGVGTSSPGYLLQVAGVGYFNTAIGVNQDPTNWYTYTPLIVAAKSQNAETAIGVGNATVGASASATYKIIGGTSNSYLNMSLADNNGSPYFVNDLGSSVTYAKWGFGGAECMRITSAGNVGIGTSSPTAKLTVSGSGFNGGSGTFISTTSGNGVAVNGINAAGVYDSAYIYLSDGANSGFVGLTAQNAPGTVGSLRFSVAGTEYARIQPNGNVGIGTTSPGYLLTVNGTGSFTGTLLANGGTVLSSVTNPANNPITGTPSSSTYLRGDGTWAAPSSPPQIQTQILTVGTGTWTAPTGVTKVYVAVVGGGGGANGIYNGGSGGIAIGEYTVSPGTGYAYTVGAGGAGINTGATANAGGSSSFASFASATGGGGGVYGNGADGTGTGGTLRNTSTLWTGLSTPMGGYQTTGAATNAASTWGIGSLSQAGAFGYSTAGNVGLGGNSGGIYLMWVG